MLDKYPPQASLASTTDSSAEMAVNGSTVSIGNTAILPADMRVALERHEDRRSSPRHRAVMRAARLSSCIHKVEGMGIVRNISEGGMLVQSHLNFTSGEHVIISLLDGDRIEGKVVWQDGTAFGIRFCSWISVDAVLAKSPLTKEKLRPRRPRLTINRPILLRSSSYLADAYICDISQHGAKIQFNKYLPIDCRVQISRGESRPATGSVKWQVGDLVGLEFHRTLSIDELRYWTE